MRMEARQVMYWEASWAFRSSFRWASATCSGFDPVSPPFIYVTTWKGKGRTQGQQPICKLDEVSRLRQVAGAFIGITHAPLSAEIRPMPVMLSDVSSRASGVLR